MPIVVVIGADCLDRLLLLIRAVVVFIWLQMPKYDASVALWLFVSEHHFMEITLSLGLNHGYKLMEINVNLGEQFTFIGTL